ncbi:MAG: GNAT family N-acetyltransferase [Acetobacter sp.]|uniref:GNAT family N-acetyltransferase n=1 Tax=Acetobacter sp. TaxID=440 RepID=UPI0039EC48E9
MSITIETLTGTDIVPILPDLARLRITVFREWPYLYDGDEAYEQTYLGLYVRSTGAAVIVARDGARIVGASTCLPMRDEMDAIRAPFEQRGLSAESFFYFGESVLLSSYRGHGLGVRFFEERERHALATSTADFATFCAVRRPADHPAKPEGATSLHAFWAKRGFQPLPGVTCTLDWKEPEQAAETSHLLDFFIKPLRGRPVPAELLQQEKAL